MGSFTADDVISFTVSNYDAGLIFHFILKSIRFSSSYLPSPLQSINIAHLISYSSNNISMLQKLDGFNDLEINVFTHYPDVDDGDRDNNWMNR